jgi:poly-beta-1,6-N-acetyl-D-glucosamine synthase
VVVAFRRSALRAIGYWSHDMLTEDIDVSWKLQTAGWLLRYEPNARVWILMPETLRGLWKQRLRWSMGGIQVMRKYGWIMTRSAQRRMWPIYLEYMTSVLWAYLMAASLLLTALGTVFDLPIAVGSFIPGWTGMLIASTCLIQFTLSLCLDSRYDIHLFKYFLWMIWYPIAYWMLSMLTTIWAVPCVLLRPSGQRAVWVSPDRGYKAVTDSSAR